MLSSGGVTFTAIKLILCFFTNGKIAEFFLFPNFSLPQPNAIKLIHNAYCHKIQTKFEYWRFHVHVCTKSFYNHDNFSFTQPNTHDHDDTYYHKIQIKYKFVLLNHIYIMLYDLITFLWFCNKFHLTIISFVYFFYRLETENLQHTE